MTEFGILSKKEFKKNPSTAVGAEEPTLYSADGRTLLSVKDCSRFEIPDSVTDIGECAFSGCVSLKEIAIPRSVESIGWNAFSGCDCIITVDADNPYYRSSDGCLIWKESNVLIRGRTDGKGNGIIPDRTEIIGVCAFWNCGPLKNITVPASVKTIDDYVFEGCDAAITVDRDNPNYYSPDGCLVEKRTDRLVRGRTDGYGNAIIPDCVKSIGDEAFYGCLSLENAVIPCSVESIGECSFGNCVSLKSVTVPHSVKSIGKEAFLGCDSLEIVTVPKSLADIGKDAFGPDVVVKRI